MTSSPENVIDSTSATTPDLAIFPFLKKCYTRVFFNQFINNHFLFLLEDSNRLQWKAADNFDKILEMVFNPEVIDAKCYSPYFLHSSIYGGPQMLKESNEITILDSAEKFFLTCKYARLNQLKFDREQMKNELLRLAGLLVIHTGRNSRKPAQPRFIVSVKNGVNFCSPDIIKESVSKYKMECASALERIDSVVPFGRLYTPIINEYFEFLDFTIKNGKKLLNKELKEVLNRWYHQFKQGKIDIDQNIVESLQYVTGPLHYLQGRPSGSAPKK